MTVPGGGAPFRHALVTGAAGGLGSALCRRLAADGVRLTLVDRNAAGLETLRTELGRGDAVRTDVVDIRDFEAFERVLQEIVGAGPPVDLVIANAGIDAPQRMDGFDWRVGRDHFSTNMVANLVLCSVLVPHMVQQGGGHVVAIASLAALAGFPYEAAYCGSKAALFAVIESARAELATKGVTFTTVCPGFLRTPMLDGNAFTVTSAMPPETAAARIHRAIGRRQPRLYFPRSTYWMIRLSNVLPVRLRDYAARRAMKWR